MAKAAQRKKMGRPLKGRSAMVPVPIRLAPEMIADLDEVAASRRYPVDRATLIRELIATGLEQELKRR